MNSTNAGCGTCGNVNFPHACYGGRVAQVPMSSEVSPSERVIFHHGDTPDCGYCSDLKLNYQDEQRHRIAAEQTVQRLREKIGAIQDIAKEFKDYSDGTKTWTIAGMQSMYFAIEKMCAQALAVSATEGRSKKPYPPCTGCGVDWSKWDGEDRINHAREHADE